MSFANVGKVWSNNQFEQYLKVLKKIGPSYAKGYKSDLSQKKISKLNNVFENVFVGENSRKRKLLREKIISDNRKIEEF